MVDTIASKAVERKLVRVRLSPPAPEGEYKNIRELKIDDPLTLAPHSSRNIGSLGTSRERG